MNKIHYKQIQDPEDQDLKQVALLFAEMYTYMQEYGLMLQLEKDGVDKWMLSLKRTLKRFTTVEVAFHGSDMIAFAHGALSMAPDYLGNKKIGVVTHIYVRPEYRKQKIAKALLEKLEHWFIEQQVHSIELQALSENTTAIDFWKEMGYANELIQFRKMV